MSHAKLDTLIDYYLGDMRRRGCTDDSVTTNQCALRRFARHARHGSESVALTDISEEVVEAYVSGLQVRTVRWPDHPHRTQETGKLSPFTIQKDVRILKGFGIWLQQEGFENPFGGLVVPKEPKRVVNVLADDEIDRSRQVDQPTNPHRIAPVCDRAIHA